MLLGGGRRSKPEGEGELHQSSQNGLTIKRVTVGSLHVELSGSVLLSGQSRSGFLIDLDGSEVLFNFTFVDESGAQPGIRYSAVGNVVEFKIVNFNNPLGTGTTAPIRVGELREQSLYLNLLVFASGTEGTRLLHYTFYRGEM